MPGLKTIIALSFVLAVGFLLVILSCALWKVYYPLLVVGTYVLAPLPNWVCSRLANPDDFVESSGNAVLDLGRFCTGFLVVMGIGTSSPPPSPPGFPLLACLLACLPTCLPIPTYFFLGITANSSFHLSPRSHPCRYIGPALSVVFFQHLGFGVLLSLSLTALIAS